MAATCTDDGKVQYWSCSVCQRNFANASADTELPDVVVPALGHDWQLSNWTWSTDYAAPPRASPARATRAIPIRPPPPLPPKPRTPTASTTAGPTTPRARPLTGRATRIRAPSPCPPPATTGTRRGRATPRGHWHACLNANCPVTDNAHKDGYAAHKPQGGGDCTQSVVCGVCGYVITPAQGGQQLYKLRFQRRRHLHGGRHRNRRLRSSRLLDHRYPHGGWLGPWARLPGRRNAPTCTEQGFTTHTCDRCGDTCVDDYTAPAGHTWGAWQESRRRALADMRRVRRGNGTRRA